MRASSKVVEVKPQFIPVELTLHFETQEELDRFYTVFNFYPVCRFIDTDGRTGGQIRQALEVSRRLSEVRHDDFNRLKNNIRTWAKGE